MKLHIDLEGHAFINGLLVGVLLGVCLTALIIVVGKSIL